MRVRLTPVIVTLPSEPTAYGRLAPVATSKTRVTCASPVDGVVKEVPL
ncbi:hypothetical protein ABZW44_48550 [Streptomyces mirabilis]